MSRVSRPLVSERVLHQLPSFCTESDPGSAVLDGDRQPVAVSIRIVASDSRSWRLTLLGEEAHRLFLDLTLGLGPQLRVIFDRVHEFVERRRQPPVHVTVVIEKIEPVRPSLGFDSAVNGFVSDLLREQQRRLLARRKLTTKLVEHSVDNSPNAIKGEGGRSR